MIIFCFELLFVEHEYDWFNEVWYDPYLVLFVYFLFCFEIVLLTKEKQNIKKPRKLDKIEKSKESRKTKYN